MARASATGVLAALLVAAASVRGAAAQDVPGSPKPSRGAPGDRPGASGALGTQGSPSLRTGTPAEQDASGETEIVERIDVSGNRRTPEARIRQRLAFEVGKPLTPDELLVSRARLVQLGTFSRVEVDTGLGSAPGRVVVSVRVFERSLLTVTDLTIAHTPVSPLYGALGVADADVAGLGLGAALTAALDGHGRHGLRATLYAPELGGRSTWVGALQGIWQEGLESACASPSCGGSYGAIPWLRYNRAGGELDAGWRPGVFSRIVFGYRLETVHAATEPGADAAARPPVHEGRSTVSAFVFAFDVDTRDDPFLPAGGSRLQLHVTLGSRALAGDYEYARYLLQAEHWFRRRSGRALRVDGAVGLVQGDAPFFDRFYAADWSYFSVGVAAPRLLELNFSPDSRYDALLLVLGVEYDISLWDAPGKAMRRGVLALGVRGVYTARTPDAGRSVLSATPVTIDAALRMETPIGVVSIGLGYVTDQILKAVPLHVPGIQYR